MVFVWSYLSGGNAAHTLVQVAINDLVILFLYAPIVIFQLGLAELRVPYDTILLSVVLYVVIPLAAGYLTRVRLVRQHGVEWLNQQFHLGLEEPIVEEDYRRLGPDELTVWDAAHPRPAGGPDFERELGFPAKYRFIISIAIGFPDDDKPAINSGYGLEPSYCRYTQFRPERHAPPGQEA